MCRCAFCAMYCLIMGFNWVIVILKSRYSPVIQITTVIEVNIFFGFLVHSPLSNQSIVHHVMHDRVCSCLFNGKEFLNNLVGDELVVLQIIKNNSVL